MKKFLSLLVVLTLAMSLFAFAASAESNDIVTLKWVAVGSGMPANYDAWQAHINEYLGEKIGVHIDVEVVPWGDWQTRRNILVNTDGDYDIMFTNDQTFANDIKIGAFAPLDDLLDEYAAELKAMIPQGLWDAASINGSIYAVPTYKDSSQSEFFIWDKDLLDANGIDVSEVKTLEDATPVLETLRDITGTAPFMLTNVGAYFMVYTYDNLGTGLLAIGVRYDDETATVVPVFEQDDIMANLQLMRQWYNDGIINSDAATLPEGSTYRILGVGQGWPYAAVTTWGPQMGVNAVAYQWGPTVLSNQSVQGSMNCINVNCEYPEKALAFLQLINTDSYVRDSFYYGLEGDNWDYTADGKVHRNNSDWSMAGYTQGTFFNVTQTDDSDYNYWDEVKSQNENAAASVMLGFAFDTTSVEDQLINCIAIYNQAKSEILTGTVDPEEGVAAMMAQMRDAGFDEIVAEAQAQIDAWMAAKSE